MLRRNSTTQCLVRRLLSARITMKFSIRHRTRHPWFFLFGCFATFGLSFLFASSDRLNAIITTLTAVGGATAFLHTRHSQEVALFRELFREFNARYDLLNERLNEIWHRPKGVSLKETDLGVLYDYFNLCAEEQMYERAGCIDADVWLAWENGMRFFASDDEIVGLWEKEIEQGSYYGFRIHYPKNTGKDGKNVTAAIAA